jgi:hypothetical protein
MQKVNIMNLSNKELKDLIFDCQSVKKYITVQGKQWPVWKERCLLYNNGHPLSMEDFQKSTITMVEPVEKVKFDKERVKDAKHSYESEMRNFLGSNWKSISRHFNIYNVPTQEHNKRALLKEIAVKQQQSV